MQGTTYISHSTFGWRNGPLFDLKNRPLFDPKYRPLFDPKNRSMLVSAVAEVDDRLIAEWDRSQLHCSNTESDHRYIVQSKNRLSYNVWSRDLQGHRKKVTAEPSAARTFFHSSRRIASYCELGLMLYVNRSGYETNSTAH